MTPAIKRARANVMSAGVYETLNVPRVKVYNNPGESGHGPGAASVGWSATEWDTDNMWPGDFGGSSAIICRTSGLYEVKAHIQFSGGAGAINLWPRIVNGAVSRIYAGQTQVATPSVFGAWLEPNGYWNAQRGDEIYLYVYTGAAVDIQGGIDQLWMTATMISTTG